MIDVLMRVIRKKRGLIKMKSKARYHIVWCPRCGKYRKMRVLYHYSEVADNVRCKFCGYEVKWVAGGG